MGSRSTQAGDTRSPRPARRWRAVIAAATGALLVFTAVAFIVSRRTTANELASVRVSGMPPGISVPVSDLMGLDSLPHRAAPGFQLTDQRGRSLSLRSFRGRVVVLEFMDPHCTDICPIVSQEFVDAYHDLGSARSKVAFVAVNVNQYHLTVSAVAAFSAQHQLDTIPDWHFFTGSYPTLRSVWSAYNIAVESRGPNADVIHSSIIYFIGPHGHERFLASPEVDHTASHRAYLPANQLTAWGHGIARVAKDLAG